MIDFFTKSSPNGLTVDEIKIDLFDGISSENDLKMFFLVLGLM